MVSKHKIAHKKKKLTQKKKKVQKTFLNIFLKRKKLKKFNSIVTINKLSINIIGKLLML